MNFVPLTDTLTFVSPQPEESGPAPETSTLLGDQRIGHLLWETSSRATLLGEPLLADIQLSFPAMGALERIAAFPGITASGLARQAFKTQQSVSQVTARLERLGYIERRVGAGRGVGLYVTQAGESALVDGEACEQEMDANLEALLGAEDTQQLRALLIRLRQRLIDTTESRSDGSLSGG
jgi:DNA-binding MarR family transcriptional regulator